MKLLKCTTTIGYRWKRSDGNDIKPNHEEALKESAIDRIIAMMASGYCCGELHDNIYMNKDDGENGTEYCGFWEVYEPEVKP